ncbi:MAG: hypothetical protein U0Q07_05745 [Acidimicrobiales bacterium]
MRAPPNADAVRSRENLVGFILELRDDLTANGAQWENPTLDDFLEALAGWCQDMPGVYRHQGESLPDQPDWRLVAQMLLAASAYE